MVLCFISETNNTFNPYEKVINENIEFKTFVPYYKIHYFYIFL